MSELAAVSDAEVRAPAQAGDAAAVAAAAMWTILCVDDEPSILSSLKRALRNPRYRVLTATSGREAIELMERDPADLVISDMRMPGMDGAQLLGQVRERWPSATRILLTGYADVTSTIAAINQGQIYRYINKPWDDGELQVTAAQALERLALEREKARLEALTRSQNDQLRSFNAELERRVGERTAEVTRANDKLKRNYMTSIKVFANLIELRGSQLVGHGRRTAELARNLAKAMGCGSDEVQVIFVAALLHDIGLIGQSDAALAKPVHKLSAEELALYRKHPVFGEQSLLALDDMQPVAMLIRAHHERFDGKGFPDGRAGADIPLGARILAIVDAHDDMLSGSLGVQGLKVADVRTLLKHGRGSQFDPEVLDVFLHINQPDAPKAATPLILGTDQLQPGMVLAADLISREGALLLSTDHVLTADLIRRIVQLEQREGARIELRVHKTKRV